MSNLQDVHEELVTPFKFNCRHAMLDVVSNRTIELGKLITNKDMESCIWGTIVCKHPPHIRRDFSHLNVC